MGVEAMSKKFQKQPKKRAKCHSVKKQSNITKTCDETIALETIAGAANVKRWLLMKTTFSCENHRDFVTKLLDLAEDFQKKKSSLKEQNHEMPKNDSKVLKKRRKTEVAADEIKPLVKISDDASGENLENLQQNSKICDKTTAAITVVKTETIVKKKTIDVEKPKKEKIQKIETVDIRKAPTHTVESPKLEQSPPKSSIVKIKQCHGCNTRHIQDQCPLNAPTCVIKDHVIQSEFDERTSDSNYAQTSLPKCLQLLDTETEHGSSVFAADELGEFTQFGPLVGKTVKEVDIPEDSTMRDLWEVSGPNGSNIYYSTEDLNVSNWMRFVRPAPVKDDRNLTVVTVDGRLFFVTTKSIRSGEELLYWQDSIMSTYKKKLEKTSCGGCNMTFTHPLYYRTHCSVFHDVRYSLTIRKYHCKVCGVAVLGKENIMKHAAELHNGQGAYQCQYCKKFFLRLNYLEMHRTYGCSANPHRSRPLCDFCGRKFCQPQKLKVHIKRMHSDFSEVLKEFQCKICLKILGSRAALQRHLKEVHQKQLDGNCSCSRCGKHFQNKSNLKIHMLTHSGIKPFKCTVKNCNAAFTTKQCLQFHYKKVHSYTEEMMPKIERSVDYTFEAYSGDPDDKNVDDRGGHSESANATMDEDSDDNSTDDKITSPLPDDEDDDEDAEDDPERMSPGEPHKNIDFNMDNLNLNPTPMKILSKGSKKWIADPPMTISLSADSQHDDYDRKSPDEQINRNETVDDVDRNKINYDRNCDPYDRNENSYDRATGDAYDRDNIAYDRNDTYDRNAAPGPANYDRNKVSALEEYDRNKTVSGLADFGRHEASNASLLVEAALDSVCSEPNIDIDVSTTPTEALVNNLYTLATPADALADVTYGDSVNLISPSDHISVTDELNEELTNQNMGIDYSGFHQEDFASPANSPDMQNRANFVRNYINTLSPPPPTGPNYNAPKTPSPPRYDFGHNSDDSNNGMAAQNLSLHPTKHDLQLDLSNYKYKLESFQNRNKDFRGDMLEKKVYGSLLDDEQIDPMGQQEEMATSLDGKEPEDRSNDMRNKLELDLDLRLKNYEEERTARSLYDIDADFRSDRNVQADFRGDRNNIDAEFRSDRNIEAEFRPDRNIDADFRSDRNLDADFRVDRNMDADFRSDRNFEPLLLNSSELQGLDMSARSFHNYPNINRYHHLYPDVDRLDLRLNYSPPPPTYTHADLLRVVSLDLTPPGRHSVDLSLRSHPLHSHRLLDQPRLLGSDLSGRLLSDHSANRILGTNDQLGGSHLLGAEQRLLGDDARLLEQGRLLGDGRLLGGTGNSGGVSPPLPAFGGYTQSPYHPTPLAPRSHVTSSPTANPYHHYSTYY